MDIKNTSVVNQLKALMPSKTADEGTKKMAQASGFEIRSSFMEFRLDLFEKSNDNFATQSGLSHLINNLLHLRFNKEKVLSTTQRNCSLETLYVGFFDLPYGM